MIKGPECFRRDQMRDKPYYHQTKIEIFKNKIFASQIYKDFEETRKEIFLPVKDGSYKLYNKDNNLIYFKVKNGAVNDLKLLKGDLRKEKIPSSDCEVTNFVYGFNSAYKKQKFIQETGYYRNEFDFHGLKQFLVMVDDLTPYDVDVLYKSPNETPRAVKNVHLCKLKGEKNFVVKFDTSKCGIDPSLNLAACEKYRFCENYLIVKDCKVELLKDISN